MIIQSDDQFRRAMRIASVFCDMVARGRDVKENEMNDAQYLIDACRAYITRKAENIILERGGPTYARPKLKVIRGGL